jgi:hypothetical protein
MQKPSTPEDKKLRSEAFRIYNWKFRKCLAPSMQCQNAPILAHSIQNGRVIDLLEDKGHVIALLPRFSQAGPNIGFRSIGRNLASAFPGFCGQHDDEIFAPLDKKPFDTADQEQLFLLAYRAVSRELHATMDKVSKIQSMYEVRVDQGIDSADEQSPVGMKAVEEMLTSWTVWKYRNKAYDEPLLARDFAGIVHDVITFPNQRPALAVSSFISAVGDIQLCDADFPGVAVNVLPVSNDTTIAIFSYARPIAGKVRSSLDRIFEATGEHQKFELSKLIIARMSNFVVAPTHFTSWSSEKIERLERAMIESAGSSRDPEEHQDLMLF